MIDYTLNIAIAKIKKAIKNFLTTTNISTNTKIEIKTKKNNELWDLSTAFFLSFRDFAYTYAYEFCESFHINGISAVVHKQGFINFTLDHKIFFNDLRTIISLKEKYGVVNLEGQTISLDHTDINPTGPAHAGHAKLAIAGDVISNFLEWCGANIKREFLVNDVGGQINIFQKSLDAYVAEHKGQQYSLNDDYYLGKYVQELAIKYAELSSEARLNAAMQENITNVLTLLKERMNIKFDNIWYEKKLQAKIPEILKVLKEYCYYYTPEKPKDYHNNDWKPIKVLTIDANEHKCILQKENGDHTYIAADIVFHKQRAEYASWLINIFGADHQLHGEKLIGLMPKIKNIHLNIILCAMVRIIKDGKMIRMSKRSGQFLELKELLDQCDADVLKFEILSRNLASPMILDTDKIKHFNVENAFYYVQYCYARTCSVQNIAKKQELWDQWEHIDFYKLTSSIEINLLKILAQWSIITQYIIEDISSIHRITEYSRLLANHFHEWWHDGTHHTLNRIFTQDYEVTKARLALVYATQTILKIIFKILGIKPISELGK